MEGMASAQYGGDGLNSIWRGGPKLNMERWSQAQYYEGMVSAQYGESSSKLSMEGLFQSSMER
jgi:hypothetical protein